jgi:magnesium/cobalt transport protein CorA
MTDSKESENPIVSPSVNSVVERAMSQESLPYDFVPIRQEKNTTPDDNLENVLDVLGLTDIDAANTTAVNSIFESSIDLSPERLHFIYRSFDVNDVGKISYNALRKGIEFWSSDVSANDLNDVEFQALAEYLDADNSKDISEDEFGNGLRMIALRRLFHDALPQGSPLRIINYVAFKIESCVLNTMEEHRAFCTGKRPEWVQTRWIDTVGEGENAAITLQRLAVKYLLHPLAVEDALEENHRPKVDSFQTHHALLIPILSLSNDEDINKERSVPRTKVDMVSIFVNIPRNDTIITFRKGKGKETDTWARLRKDLHKKYSKIRQHNAQYALYAMLDAAVDRIPPLVKEIGETFDEERKWLVAHEYVHVDRIASIREEILRMVRQLKPFQRVLTHVIEDDAICTGATIYLKDVRDNLECSVDDLKEMVERCDRINLEYEKYHQGSMDRRLYLMTVVTSIFLPAQFLTGVYGMNFVTMPELAIVWAYPIFWVITILGTLTLLYLFDCGRLNRRS